jgi:ABC-type uncharacterized transport system substrate-binding protein
MMGSVENELEKCFDKFQEKLLMAGYDVEFENKNEIIEKVSEPILDVIQSSFFSEIMVNIVVKSDNEKPLVGKFIFGNSMDFIEDSYFRLDKYYPLLFAKGNYVEFAFVLYDREVYKEMYSSEDENKISQMPVDEIVDEHLNSVAAILEAYDIKPKYDDYIDAVTFKMPLGVEIKRLLV